MSGPAPPACRTGNWPAYDDALKRRGSLTIWSDPAMTWEAAPNGKRGTRSCHVDESAFPAGATLLLPSTDPAVVASIRAMTAAHGATMNGVEGWDMQAEVFDGDAVMTVTGHDIVRFRGLGFIGLATVGMHHQARHLALASGQNPHDH
jgi:hypothetical protein